MLIERIGQRVVPDDWASLYEAQSAVLNATGLVDLLPVAALEVALITKLEAKAIGNLAVSQIVEIQDALARVRGEQPTDPMSVSASKAVIKGEKDCGVLLIGLNADDNLVQNRMTVLDILREVTGFNDPVPISKVRYGVNLGRVFNRSREFYHGLMDGLDENIVPEFVRLGPIVGATTGNSDNRIEF